jgi:hypothetical protein
MAKQQPKLETGVRPPDKPERPVESYEADLADGAQENAKSSDTEKRAVADAVSDLDGND